ncbi:hypothetical protein PYH37_000753 [Sinorhizobium numidicum]|uniref:Uncharacterized protein n=2 Tax=Sinorhizobium numidicum TaxID=680248 RepID=A0ABY8CRT0_9HYPH|nr:hypothetical protein [Sinorhizobium numidicum]WEX75355.1 hypothetical protein PYH37_000753 [Sinorhizobium numidicum]WEX81350.1 hypothetical protein PYH38_000755 [Sinorhizobium numidicum]
MPMSRHPVVAPDEHILTVQEALEPLYMKLEQEAEVQLLEAAVSAGWSADEALDAIDELKKHEVLSMIGRD